MTETTREERDEWRIQLAAHAIADDDESPDDIGFWNRAIDDADRLAAIERDVRELMDKWRKEMHGCCGCADELESILDPKEG